MSFHDQNLHQDLHQTHAAPDSPAPCLRFTALPDLIFTADLGPGAFRTIAELCRMANRAGECWPSLDQLGERMGRSKAAISGYLNELREAGLLITREQHTANGYNSRLFYVLPFWPAFRAGFGHRQAQQPIECRVQPDERKDKSLNQIHENQQPGGCVSSLSDQANDPTEADIQAIETTIQHQPWPHFAKTPDPALIAKLRKPLLPPARLRADIAQFIARHAPQADRDSRASFEAILTEMLTGASAALPLMMAALARDWQPHWRRLPAPAQLRAQIETLIRSDLALAAALKPALMWRSFQGRFRVWESRYATAPRLSGYSAANAA